MKIKILADQYLYKLDKMMPAEVELIRYNPDDGFPENAVEFDVLLIRTVTKINSDTLPETGRLKFIGSATAGFDHVEQVYLENQGITFERSEGCNANAVGEYVVTVLHRWAHERKADFQSTKIGIVGCGNTGSSVVQYLQKLGIETVSYDPPKARREPGFSSAGLEELLTCDILTFHTPLSRSGTHSTFHLCSEKWLSRGFDLIINTARGGVVDEQALLKAQSDGLVRDFILDVWEGEPVFGNDSGRNAFIATPHIAGYSKQAKWKASEIVVKKMLRFFGLNQNIPKSSDSMTAFSEVSGDQSSFAGFLWHHSNVKDYDRELRKLIGLDDVEKALKFARLRSETETRNEFSAMMGGSNYTAALPENLSIFVH
ncbi:MAG: 4-phosphoerythronate dehydrogenase [Balneolaceae bacterium]|nr:4-phosphoerythronate dehydrogenase [Balneolaceae bacterium]